MSLSLPSRNVRPWSPHGFCLTAVLMWWATGTEATAVQIFVLYPNNLQRAFEVELSDSIDWVKTLVQDRSGEPPDSQYLYYDNRLLLDGRTLRLRRAGRCDTPARGDVVFRFAAPPASSHDDMGVRNQRCQCWRG